MTRRISLWDDMLEDVLSATTEQMGWLINQVGFQSAIDNMPPEDLANMGDAKLDMVLPHLNIGPELLSEAVYWLSNSDPRYQNVAEKLIKTHAQKETSSSNDTLLNVKNAVLKYNQTPSDPMMKRFAQAYEHQRNIEQSKRIATELAQSEPTETVKPTKNRRKL